MNKDSDRAVDKTLRKIIDDKSLTAEDRRLLMQYMEEMRKNEEETAGHNG